MSDSTVNGTAAAAHQESAAPDSTLSDQVKLLEALRQHTLTEQFKQYHAQKAAHHPVPVAAPETPEDEGIYTAASLGSKKLHEIKQILKDQGKRVTGNKEDLIARILGLAEPSAASKPTKKRSSEQITDGSGSEEEDDDEDPPATKKFKVDKDDPLWNICFLCQSTDQLVKYKDIRQCIKCKAYWKGKRLLEQDAHEMFLLEPEDLTKLPHKETQPPGGGATINLYAFATCAGAAVKKYGSLYAMVKSQPAQRDNLAHQIYQERTFAEQQKLHAEYDVNAHATEHLPPSALPATRPDYASVTTSDSSSTAPVAPSSRGVVSD